MAINAQEDLAFIRKMMADTQTIMVDDGKPAIVWGILVAIGMVATYIGVLTNTDFGIAWMWIALSLIGWGYVYYYRVQKVKRTHTRTLAGRMIGAIWGASGFAIGLVIVLTFVSPSISGMQIISPLALTSITAIILGVAYFISGLLYGKRWVSYLSLGWWTGAVVMMLWPTVHVLVIYALMLVAFQIVPGIILYRNSKRGNAEVSIIS